MLNRSYQVLARQRLPNMCCVTLPPWLRLLLEPAGQPKASSLLLHTKSLNLLLCSRYIHSIVGEGRGPEQGSSMEYLTRHLGMLGHASTITVRVLASSLKSGSLTTVVLFALLLSARYDCSVWWMDLNLIFRRDPVFVRKIPRGAPSLRREKLSLFLSIACGCRRSNGTTRSKFVSAAFFRVVLTYALCRGANYDLSNLKTLPTWRKADAMLWKIQMTLLCLSIHVMPCKS